MNDNIKCGLKSNPTSFGLKNYSLRISSTLKNQRKMVVHVSQTN